MLFITPLARLRFGTILNRFATHKTVNLSRGRSEATNDGDFRIPQFYFSRQEEFPFAVFLNEFFGVSLPVARSFSR